MTVFYSDEFLDNEDELLRELEDFVRQSGDGALDPELDVAIEGESLEAMQALRDFDLETIKQLREEVARLNANNETVEVILAFRDLDLATIKQLREEVACLNANVEYLEAYGTMSIPIPPIISADAVFAALPENWRRALEGAALAVAPVGTKFFPDPNQDKLLEHAAMIAGSICVAHKSARKWIEDVDRRTLPEEVRQALLIFDGVSASAMTLLDMLGADYPGTYLDPHHAQSWGLKEVG
jgi:hypothetical protein